VFKDFNRNCTEICFISQADDCVQDGSDPGLQKSDFAARISSRASHKGGIYTPPKPSPPLPFLPSSGMQLKLDIPNWVTAWRTVLDVARYPLTANFYFHVFQGYSLDILLVCSRPEGSERLAALMSDPSETNPPLWIWTHTHTYTIMGHDLRQGKQLASPKIILRFSNSMADHNSQIICW
jgi:hypothetical protein